MSIVPLWNGETVDCRGTENENRLFNRFGGGTVASLNLPIRYTSAEKHSGTGAFLFQANIAPNHFGFAGPSLTGFGPTASYIDTRSLAGFEQLRFWIRNATGTGFRLVLELKDHRDSNFHRARLAMVMDSSTNWVEKVASLPSSGANGWTIIGQPDFTRTKLILFVVETIPAVVGPVYLDDLVLVEEGGPLDIETGPISDILHRLTKRQFFALWGSRDRSTGLLPINSQFADIVALNATAGLIQILPRAIAEGWVTEVDANFTISQIVESLHFALDEDVAIGAGFLPPRYMNRLSLSAAFGPEESPVDAAFMFLALFKYKALPTISVQLRNQIESLLNRFNFNAFSSPAGWKLAYDLTAGEFTAGAYDGYSGEIYLISLAAHLNRTHHVDITSHFHSGVNRVEVFLQDSNRAHLVHSSSDFRAPFLQWLFDIFVNTRGLGADTYPNPSFSSNPRSNALRYQRDVHAELFAHGRALFLQPDASDDGTCQFYQQFSAYNDFARPELFMPWSVAFSFFADAKFSEAALRNSLLQDLHGPLGLLDSARWVTGESKPNSFPSRIDFWNLVLSEMAFVEYLYADAQTFTNLPEVREALEKVFRGLQVALTRISHHRSPKRG